jgi:DNA repair exonuclease SbcCD ATPase subunit
MRVDKDTTVELSIGQQMDPPFLVFEPESMRAKFVNVLTGGHVVDAAVRESNRVIKEIGEEAKRVEAEHTRVTQELAQYADLPEREAKIHELGEILGRANVCAQKAKILRETRERILAIRDQKSWANAKGHIVSWVTDTEVARVSNFTERLTILKRIKDSLAQIAWKRTSQVAQVTILAYVDDQTIVRTGQMGEYAKSLKAIKERLNGIRSQRIGATYALTALQDITPVLADHVRTLMDRRTALVQAQKSLADTRRKKTDTLNQLASVESRMEDLRHEVEALADGVCEACGQMVTKDVRRKQLMEIA